MKKRDLKSNCGLTNCCERTRDVKSCQIRHPEVQIRYPDTFERSHRIASYVLVNDCMVYVGPYCSIYDIFETIMTRPPQLQRNETFCKIKLKKNTCLSPKI